MRALVLGSVFSLLSFPLTAGPGNAPVLQWVKQIPGSGQSFAAAAAVDSQGNLIIAGNTSALDLPTVSAYQSHAGSSTLTRVDATSGAAQKLYAPLLSGASTFAFDPQNPVTLYAVSSSDPGDTDASSNWTSSFIRSTDNGATWTSLSTFPSGAAIFSITVDPAHSNVLYVSDPKFGVLKSTDGGLTFNAANQGLRTNNSGQLGVYQIWVDPQSSSVLFSTSVDGLARSSDGGATWSVVLSGANTNNSGNIAFDPFTPGTIYQGGALNSQFIRKSTDDGLTWTPLPNSPVSPSYSWADRYIWVDPVHRGVLYFTTPDYQGGLYRSDDGGVSWSLKIGNPVGGITFDPAHGAMYVTNGFTPAPILVSSDGFDTYRTWQSVGRGNSVLNAGSSLLVTNAIGTDVFVTKLDPNGNIVYSTYFGGSGQDLAAGVAVGADGSVYVTGSTQSTDFPISAGAFLGTFPGTNSNASFVFKLNPDGSLGWSTYFADSATTVSAIAVDASGSPYLSGSSGGNLPVTPGAYQSTPPFFTCPAGSIFCAPPGPAGFLAKFKADGSALAFATYVDLKTGSLSQQFAAVALDANGNAYMTSVSTIGLLSADGASLLASNAVRCQCSFNALAIGGDGEVYAAGSGTTLPTTPGAFQSALQPVIPSLPGAGTSQQEAVVVKFDAGLTQIMAATFLGGEIYDRSASLAVDKAGNVILAGNTNSKGFPTRAPFQSTFSQSSGFVAELDSGLSTLLFSTILGDRRFFGVAGAYPDNQGNVLLAGSALESNTPSCAPQACNVSGGAVFANRIALAPSPTLRLDAIDNAASQLGTALSPSEMISVVGDGFGPDAQLLLNGAPIPVMAQTANRLTAQLPSDLDGDAAVLTVASAGSTSNAIVAPVTAASPGLYSVDGSGYGQGYILNSDGTMNSPSNPAAVGSAVTVFANGVGSISLTDGYAVTAQPVSVFIDGFYANGIAASLMQMPGLPPDTYGVSVYIPNLAQLNPDLKNFKMPSLVPVLLVSGANASSNPAYSVMRSQPGLALSVAQ